MGIREDAVVEALKWSPHSIRAVALEAGVSEKLLRSIRDGKRVATPRVVKALARAMTVLADRQTSAAHILLDAIKEKEV